MSTEIKTPDLEQIAANYKKAVAPLKRRVIICGGTGCIANGSMKVRDAICAELEKAGERVEVVLDHHDSTNGSNITATAGRRAGLDARKARYRSTLARHSNHGAVSDGGSWVFAPANTTGSRTGNGEKHPGTPAWGGPRVFGADDRA